MRKVEFLDTSLDGEHLEHSIKEKIAIAKQLEKWAFLLLKQVFLQPVLIPSLLFKQIAVLTTLP